MEQKGKRSVVASGKNVEEAIGNGLVMLGVRRDQVDIEILHPGSRGLLGIGAENARVQLTVKAPPAPVPKPPVEPSPRVEAPPRREPPAPERKPRESRPPQPSREQRAPEAVASKEQTSERGAPEPVSAPVISEADVAQVGRELLAELLRQMGIQATVEIGNGVDLIEEGEQPPLVLNIKGEDLGMLIGRRGETLAAIQYLLRLMVSHRVKHWTDLVVDVENYRARRRKALESLALRVAERVVASGRTQALEPMPAYERRLVHIALRNHPQVTTQSVGVGEKRKVTIVLRSKQLVPGKQSGRAQ